MRIAQGIVTQRPINQVSTEELQRQFEETHRAEQEQAQQQQAEIEANQAASTKKWTVPFN